MVLRFHTIGSALMHEISQQIPEQPDRILHRQARGQGPQRDVRRAGAIDQ